MGCCLRTFGYLVLFLALAIGYVIYSDRDPGMPDSYRADHYWGAKVVKEGSALPKDDPAIKPFKITVPDTVLTDLKDRIKNARIAESFSNNNFEYGLNSKTLRTIQDYWLNKFDWKKQEQLLNSFNHFKTQIEGLDIHYMHIKPTDKSAKKVLPIMVSHGWPGSIVEFLKLIPLLSQTKDGVAFELVVPSIPGYGWSEAAHKTGLNSAHVARIYSKLMTRLGHEKFYYHGDDWGAIIGKAISLLVPDRIRGLHVTMPIVKFGTPSYIVKTIISYLKPDLILEKPEVEYKRIFPFGEKFIFVLRESGYMHIQATKPDTVGAALSDSPLGLAAYIIEKFSTWTDPAYLSLPDGGITKKFTMDELLTNVMVYWVTNSITSSQRFYKEGLGHHMFNELKLDRIEIPATVPTAIIVFPNELMYVPKLIVAETYKNITQYNFMPRGGHFAAFEEPQLVADDIRAFVKKLEL